MLRIVAPARTVSDNTSTKNFKNEEFYDSWKLLDSLERNYDAFCKRIAQKKFFTIKVKVGKGVNIKNNDFNNYHQQLHKYNQKLHH